MYSKYVREGQAVKIFNKIVMPNGYPTLAKVEEGPRE